MFCAAGTYGKEAAAAHAAAYPYAPLGLLPKSADDFWDAFVAASFEKMQRHLTAGLDRKNVPVAFPATPHAQARYRSLTSKGASRWITTVPTKASHSMHDDHFRVAVRHMLGLPATDSLPDTCVCQADLRVEPHHFHVCPQLRQKATRIRHDLLVQTLARIARHADIVAEVETTRPIDGKRTRPDLLLVGTSAVLVDVTVSHPLAATFVERAAEVNNHVAEQRARDKHAKYDALAKQELVDFKAYSADAFGAVSNDARDLVRWMATEACAFGAASYSDFVSDAIACLSFALQTGNARLALSAASRVSHAAHRARRARGRAIAGP